MAFPYKSENNENSWCNLPAFFKVFLVSFRVATLYVLVNHSSLYLSIFLQLASNRWTLNTIARLCLYFIRFRKERVSFLLSIPIFLGSCAPWSLRRHLPCLISWYFSVLENVERHDDYYDLNESEWNCAADPFSAASVAFLVTFVPTEQFSLWNIAATTASIAPSIFTLKCISLKARCSSHMFFFSNLLSSLCKAVTRYLT